MEALCTVAFRTSLNVTVRTPSLVEKTADLKVGFVASLVTVIA